MLWVDLAKDYQVKKLNEPVAERIERQCNISSLARSMRDGSLDNHSKYALFLDHTDEFAEADLCAAIDSVLSKTDRIKVRPSGLSPAHTMLI